LVQALELVKKKLDSSDTFIILTSPRVPEYKSVGLDILKYFVNEKKSPVIYICIDKPISSIMRVLEKDNVDSNIIVFIDAVTVMSGTEPKGNHCLYIKSPENLTDMSIALSEAISSLPRDKTCIIVDSLSTLLVYNNLNTVVKFVHILTAKIKQYGAKGVAISTKKGHDDDFVSQIFKFFDDSVDFSGGS